MGFYSFFNLYLNLQSYIVKNRHHFEGRELAIDDIKEKVRQKVNIKFFKNKMIN